jgi:hypothetical protein
MKQELQSAQNFQCYNSPIFRTLHTRVSMLLITLRQLQEQQEFFFDYNINMIDNNIRNIDDVKRSIYNEINGDTNNDVMSKVSNGADSDTGAIERVFYMPDIYKKDKPKGHNLMSDCIKDVEQNSNDLLGFEKEEEGLANNEHETMDKIFYLSLRELEVSRREKDAKLLLKTTSQSICDAFNQFFTGLLFHALPACILYYPCQKVVGCDITLLQSLLASSRAKNDSGSILNISSARNRVVSGGDRKELGLGLGLGFPVPTKPGITSTLGNQNGKSGKKTIKESAKDQVRSMII